MENLYNTNGLMFWNEGEIEYREHLIRTFSRSIFKFLWLENPAWQSIRCEAPLLTPSALLNSNYTSDDIFGQTTYEVVDDELQVRNDNLALRPETTPGSYIYAQHLLNTHTGHKPPLCVWQAGKSFRREQEQVIKNMRLKEFYQQEFQCVYAADTKNDYHTAILEPVRKMLSDAICLPARVVASDRLPSYSEVTMDVEIDVSGFDPTKGWMEVCSISRRTDFPQKLCFPGKNGMIEKDALVLEIAIGLDRCIYLYGKRCETTR